MKTISVTLNGSSGRLFFLPISNRYICEIYKRDERCPDVIFKLTLYCLSVTVEDLNLQRRSWFVVLNSALGAP